MANGNRTKSRRQKTGLFVKGFQPLIFHAILPIHLLDEQLAVAVDVQGMMRPEALGVFQRANEGSVLGLIVGRFADAAGFLDWGRALALDDIGKSRRSRIAARTAVNGCPFSFAYLS